MKLLLYGINYAPELTGIGKYTGEMAAFYAEQGHDVEVITAPPYYPQWKVKEGYRNWWNKERKDGVTVLRSPLYVPGEVTGVKRIIHEFSFVLSSLRWWIPRYFRAYDAIVCISPPFHLGFAALPHKWLRGTPVINHIQDLQVDAARDLGMIKSNALLSVLEGLEKWLLRRVSRVSTISEGMRRKLQSKFTEPQDVIMFPNWVDSSVIFPLPSEQSLRKEWGFGPGDKVVLYSGNLGEKQGLDAILRVADRMREQENVHFVIVGDGGVKDRLKELAEKLRLVNVRFLPLLPLESLSAMLATADVHLVLQKKAAADLVMPSKLTNILAAGGHALVTADKGTTLHDTVNEHRLGSLVPAEDEVALQQGLTQILSGNLHDNASGATTYADTYLSKHTILSAFLKQIASRPIP